MLTKTTINNYINYLALFYAFSLPLSRGAIVIFSVLLTLLWIIEGSFKEKFNTLKKSPFIISIVVFILFSLFSLLWVESENISLALKYIKKYWYLITLFVLATSLKRSYIPKVLYAFLAGMTVSMIVSWGIYFEWWQIKEVTQKSLSPFMYHVFYSIFLAFSALISLNFAIHSKNRALSLLYIILFVLFTAILFLGIGRTGQAIFIIGLFVLLVSSFEHKLKALSSAFIISIVLLGVFYTFNDNFKQRVDLVKSDTLQMVDNDQYCNSIGGRIFTWKVSYKIFQKHPIIGIGIGDHLVYLKKAMNTDESFSKCGIKDMIDYFHGQYIEIISQTGILGLFLFLSIFYFLIKIKTQNKMLESIKYILVISFLFVFIVDLPFRKQFTVALFALISSLIVLEKRVADEV